jgi:hypothetical protein
MEVKILMKAIFRKELYYKHMVQITEKDSIELYKNLQGEPEWIEKMDGIDITRFEVEANQAEKDNYKIETLFVVNSYSDLAEYMGRVIIHPDWVERIKE